VRCPFAQSGKKDNTVRSGKCQSLYIFKSTCAELDNTFGSEVHGLNGDEPGENEGHQDGGAHEAEGERPAQITSGIKNKSLSTNRSLYALFSSPLSFLNMLKYSVLS